MVALTYGWEGICNIFPDLVYGSDAASWIYKNKEGVYSLLYSNLKFTWVLGKLPIAIDILYPGNGMIYLVGYFGYLAKLRGWFDKK